MRMFLAIIFLVAIPGFAQTTAPSAPMRLTVSQEELDSILAPIALYPDSLLSQVLMASTYPRPRAISNPPMNRR